MPEARTECSARTLAAEVRKAAEDAGLTLVPLTSGEVRAIEQALIFVTQRLVGALAKPWKTPADLALLQASLDDATSALRKIRGAP